MTYYIVEFRVTGRILGYRVRASGLRVQHLSYSWVCTSRVFDFGDSGP